jgi:hypothetical protein
MKLEQIIFAKEAVSFMKTICVSPKLTTSIVGLFFLRLFSALQELKGPYKKSNQSEMTFLTKVIIT